MLNRMQDNENNKKFLPGGYGQSAGRKAQSENTIHAVRKAPCAMRLPLAAGGKIITRSN